MMDKKADAGAEQSSTDVILPNAVGVLPPLRSSVALMFFSGDATTMARLAPGKTLVIGRSASADVRLLDRALSHRHAQVTLHDQGVLVEDLASTNGTLHAAMPITSKMISLGDEFLMGRVMARVVALGIAVEPPIMGEAAFRKRLDEELLRGRRLHRHLPLTLLAVRVGNQEVVKAPNGTWLMHLSAHLQSFDRVTLCPPDIALVLLPQMGRDEALHVANRIAENAHQPECRRFVGAAVYPEDGCTVDQLIATAHDALRQTRQEHWVHLASREDAVRQGNGVSISSGEERFYFGARMKSVLRTIDKFAGKSIPVLLLGETGTGKEVLARRIHDNGPRGKKPFEPVNCASIPKDLFESEFFGHEKGAFTSAAKDKQGLFEAANGGTLFFDELGELPLQVQGKLLRVLQDGKLRRVGSTEEVTVDVRIIAATNGDPAAMVAAGVFRRDLYHRLNTLIVKLPPLRERKDELLVHCDKFARDACKKDQRQVIGISEEAKALIQAYDWPGNLRELQNAIVTAVVIAEGDVIQREDLPEHIRAGQPEPENPPSSRTNDNSLEAKLGQAEKQAIEEALQKAAWVQAKAAPMLVMNARTLSNKIKKYGIVRPPNPSGAPRKK